MRKRLPGTDDSDNLPAISIGLGTFCPIATAGCLLLRAIMACNPPRLD